MVRKEYNHALADANKAIALEPKSADAYLNRINGTASYVAYRVLRVEVNGFTKVYQ